MSEAALPNLWYQLWRLPPKQLVQLHRAWQSWSAVTGNYHSQENLVGLLLTSVLTHSCTAVQVKSGQPEFRPETSEKRMVLTKRIQCSKVQPHIMYL